ncbi:MAG: DUF2961 domain-containing protein [Chloroflexi bacterium]|nr:DUF2961 domain-containing protein [Chloroflexota bacterium]
MFRPSIRRVLAAVVGACFLGTALYVQSAVKPEMIVAKGIADPAVPRTAGRNAQDNDPSRAPSTDDARSNLPADCSPALSAKASPAYSSSDFLSGYLDNRTAAMIVDAKPWSVGSVNMTQYRGTLGGSSFWDFWSPTEPWTSPNHLWQDDAGQWRPFTEEQVVSPQGSESVGYVLVDRTGPGVLEELWFTQDTLPRFDEIVNPASWFQRENPADLLEWGDLSRLGNLRILVDDKVVYDGPIEDWFSGAAQKLPPELQSIFVWRFQQFGSDGNIVPIPYQKHLQVLTYSGTAKPKWFMANGVRFSAGTEVQSYADSPNSLPLDAMKASAKYVTKPEDYVDSWSGVQDREFTITADEPAAIELPGAGTIEAIQFRVKAQDTKSLHLTVTYGGETGIDLPFLAFFGDAGRVEIHHSTPIGAVNAGDAVLFYSNFPMPYQNGIEIRVSGDNSQPVPMSVRLAADSAVYNTKLRVRYGPPEQLNVYGPDYRMQIDGDGKLVGLVLATEGQRYDLVPKVYLPGEPATLDPEAAFWPMAYLEGNLALSDGTGSFRLYGGQEDWAGGGYYFNSGYLTPPGGSNRPFGGLLRYDNGENGYATIFRYFNDLSAFRFKNGLQMSFGHGTWRNNFAVQYGVTAFYYLEVRGMAPVVLPTDSLFAVDSAACRPNNVRAGG